MAELYESPKQYLSAGGQSGNASNAQPSIDSIIQSLPPEEREEALKYITAPPTGEEIARAMAEKNSRGELMEMNLDQYRLYKAHQKTKETDVIETIGQAAGTVYDEIFKAAGSVYDKPVDSLAKLTPSVIEAFAQGTRGLYGMAAQSADPTSALFRVKNALMNNGDDEASEYQQFMEAQAFNLHSMRLMTGQDTIIMDKDIINPEVTQVMSYIADPTLFIPFGGIAAKGATMIGMGEKLAAASARTAAIKRMVLGGALKWGVGAPIEFLGTAVRNTIDYGLERGSKAFEAVTGMPAAEVKTTAQLYGWNTASAAMSGATVPLPVVGNVAGALVGSTTARGVGEAISALGEQMMKQKNTGRGVLGYAGQALRDTKKNGVVLSKHATKLLEIIEAVDPFFAYADEITAGAMQGALIGGGLGYLAGNEEGMAGGIGSGMALGSVGAGVGRFASDVTGNTKMEQIGIQRKLVIEGLKQLNNENAVGLEALAEAARLTGDRVFQAQIDGIIAGIDVVDPDAVIKAYNKVRYEAELKVRGIDPNTGKPYEKSRIFPELGDRRTIADVLGILRDNGNRFAGDPKGFEQAIMNDPAFAKLKPVWSRLDDNAKATVLKQIERHADPEFVKSLKGRTIKDHFSDIAYAERLVEMINTLNQSNANLVPVQIERILKNETRSDKKLTRRGQMLKEKLQADGYIDKDGTIRKSRNPDVEETIQTFESSAGWTKRRLSTGQTEIIINLDVIMEKGNRESMPHELFHSIMRNSVFAKDYGNRLLQKLVGTFDPATGKLLEKAVIDPDQFKKFMYGYINSVHRNQSEEFRKRKIDEVNAAFEDFKKRGDQNRVNDGTPTQLEALVEEFGAYYFAKFVMDKPVDFLFRGGEYSGLRAIFETSKESFLDFWKAKIGQQNPSVNFDNIEGFRISQGFGKEGRRAKVTALDLFMQDVIRMQANLNRGGRFDISNLSPEARKDFIKNYGLRGENFELIDKEGNLRKKPRLRKYTAEEIRQGKEMYKVLESLSDDQHKGGMHRDGDGNWSGKPNTAQINALVGAGFIQRAWFDRLNFAYNIIEGRGSNIVEFGYLGYSAHIGDGPERVYGAAVPFKNRRAILLDVDFKVRADGTTFANFHTLDLKVIEARGNEIWRDPQVRDLWNGDRTSMEADFYAYLSNASLPSGDDNRKPSVRLLDRGDGLGGQRRDALHQMLGFHKGSDIPYINKPISEIPVGIRHSVTTFSNDGIVAMRTDGNKRVNYNHNNAHLDLSRNFMPSEMKEEKTPSGGRVIKHGTGYNISKQAGEKFKVFDPEGKLLGQFDNVADAGRAAQKHFNENFDKRVEGVDPAVPPTEVPPSRVAYSEKRIQELIRQNNYEERVLEQLEAQIAKEKSRGLSDVVVSYNTKHWRESIELIRKKGLLGAINDKSFSITADIQPKTEGEFNGTPWRSVRRLIEDIKLSAEKEYDNMYPFEIKSALYPTIAQIFQDYPNLTAKGLIGKIQKYGSLNKTRLMQEAIDIGLIDFLKAKPKATKVKREIYRAYDPFQQDFTGEVKVKETNVQYEPNMDVKEILDFVKSKEIKVTIEEGAKEVNNMNTAALTLGGDKLDYKETAIRINPEYAHGVLGHYGDDVIVHFRTTVRFDSEGNKVLFIEEVQSQNKDRAKRVTESEYRQAEQDVADYSIIESVTVNKNLRDNSSAGGFRFAGRNLIEETKIHIPEWKYNADLRKELKSLINDFAVDLSEVGGLVNKEWWERNLKDYATFEAYMLRSLELVESRQVGFSERYNAWKEQMANNQQFRDSFNKIIRSYYTSYAEAIKIQKSFPNILKGTFTPPNGSSESQIAGLQIRKISELIRQPNTVIERSSDALTKISQFKNIKPDAKPKPLTEIKDTALTALKGIIRQAIRDGLDKVTLTHPEDSPTVSNMSGNARKDLYGKIIPELWASWLEKYGIKINQENKLVDAGIDKAKSDMASISDKIHDAEKAVLEKFEKVGMNENPDVINNLNQYLMTPVHQTTNEIHLLISDEAEKLNNVELTNLIKEVGFLKKAQYDAYQRINEIRELGVRGTEEYRAKNGETSAQISAEAIDRGYTFQLNDDIKRAFKEGKISTYAMPAEEGFSQGGRVYDQEGVRWKFGFIGRYAHENPEITNNVSIQTINKQHGETRLVFTDNSNGQTRQIGHITWSKFGGISANIAPEYRGKNLSYLLYSEAAERMRAMGIKNSISTIVNEFAIPVAVREKIFGNTRWVQGRNDAGVPINREQAQKAIAERRRRMAEAGESGAQWAGINVRNDIDPKAWYMPSEGEQGGRTYTPEQMAGKFIGRVASENPKLTKYKKVVFTKDTVSKEGEATYRLKIVPKDEVASEVKVGYINVEVNGTDATVEYVKVNPRWEGEGYGQLLYSEMVERLRSLGVKEFSGMIIDEQGRPQKIRKRIIDQENTRIGETDDTLIGRRRSDGEGGTQTDVTSYLKEKAWYMPSEENKSGNFDFTVNGNKATKLMHQYFAGLKEGKSHQELMTPELEYLFSNIESFTKASNDDIVRAIEKLGSRGEQIINNLNAGKITIKEATQQALNIDDYTYRAKLKDIRDERKNLYKKFLEVTGQKRKVSEEDSRRSNTGAEREHRNTSYMPAEEHPWTKNIARAQRDLPEDAMRMAQFQLGGGAISKLIEHSGDILHRTYQGLSINDGFGYHTVLDKVEKSIDNVREISQRGFWKVEEENYPYILENGREGTGKTWEEHKKVIKNMLGKFGDEHSKLPAYNDLQKTVKAINVSVGKLDFLTAELELLKLKRKLKTQESWNQYASEGIEKFNKGDSFNAMPAENSTLARRYELDQAIVDKIKPTFKFPYKELTAKEMLQFIIDNNGHMSPLAKELLASLDEHGLGARIGQQTSTKGSRQIGTPGWSWHNYNSGRNRIHMILERKVEDKKKYGLISFEELMMEEILHAVTLEKTPEPIKHGSTIEDTLKTVENFLRNKDKYKEQYREDWKEVAGAKEEWFTIADAYRKVHQQVQSGKYLDGTEFTKLERHSIDYRLSNMGEFVIGITQTKEIQRILSDIKVPKTEATLLTKILDAIKAIWNFDDKVMGSLLEHTSDAVEKVIRRDKTQMERAGVGRFPQRAKDYFGGMPKSDSDTRRMPAEYQGGDDYYKPKKNIFEYRDDQGLLVRKANVWNSEITGDPEARGGQQNPDYVGWEDIGHYPQTGETRADNIWEAKNSGLWYWKDDKGIKTKNPLVEMDRPDFTHAEWFDKSFKYEDDKPTIYGRYEKPKYDKKGNLLEKGRISITSNYRGEVKNMADANFYKETVAETLGVPADHIDAYLFGANDNIKKSMGFGLKDQLPIKFQPAEGWRDWKSEQTSIGSVFKNAVGYVIMVQGDKFKVYNPYKAMVGIYSDLEQAKRRVQRDEPKQ